MSERVKDERTEWGIVWVVVNELVGGGSEIVGVYSELGEAMVQSSKQKSDKVEETYVQQQPIISRKGNTVSLRQFYDWVETEEGKK